MYARLRLTTVPTLTIEHPAERILLSGLLSLVALCVMAYVYFIGASTFHIIATKQAEVSSAKTENALAKLNTEYYKLSAEITPEYAASMGLAPIAESQKEYVTRDVHLGYAGPVDQ